MKNSVKNFHSPKPTEGLTQSQERLIETIRTLIAEYALPPTVQELANILGMKGASVHEQLGHLVRKGYLRRTPRKARSLEIVDQPPPMSETVLVPIVGTVTAGMPILAVENQVGQINVEVNVVRGLCFALEVQGDSMIEADIKEGDYLIVRQQPIAENGDIVVALIANEATVKRLFISEDRIELRPANPAYPVMRIGPEDDLKILGKVLAVRGRASVN